MVNMGKFGIFMANVYNKSKEFVKEEIEERKELNAEIDKLSDKQLKHLAVAKGGVYKDKYLQRIQRKKELAIEIKNL